MTMKNTVKLNHDLDRTAYMRILITLIGIIFLLGVVASQQTRSEPISITVMPSVPREGVPILITLNLNNPLPIDDLVHYELYANGMLLTRGSAGLNPSSTELVKYLYTDTPTLGEKITFLVRTRSMQGSFEKSLSIPAYPPQIWSSFVSFASFSTSMSSTMGVSITSMYFYDSSFMKAEGINVGLVFSLTLIFLLVFLELTEPIHKKGLKVAFLRIRFSRLSAVLFIVFVGMVLTKIVLILR